MTKYLFTMQKKGEVTTVGCVALTLQDNKVKQFKIIVENFNSQNLKEDIQQKWSWVNSIQEENKVWISSSTNIEPMFAKYKDILLKRVTDYSEHMFLDYKIIDLLTAFQEKNGREANAIELNIMIAKHIEKIIAYIKENPNAKKNFPILDYFNSLGTNQIINFNDLINSYNAAIKI